MREREIIVSGAIKRREREKFPSLTYGKIAARHRCRIVVESAIVLTVDKNCDWEYTLTPIDRKSVTH